MGKKRTEIVKPLPIVFEDWWFLDFSLDVDGITRP